jgi:hypothetical protein
MLCGLAVSLLLTGGCSTSKPEPQYTVALLDDTAEFAASPGANDAWHDAIERTQQDVSHMPTGAEVSVYTMANTRDFTPHSRVEWVKDFKAGKIIISARHRKAHTQELEDALNALPAAMRAHPVKVQTRLVETLFELIRSLRDRTSPSSRRRLTVASDMQPYSPNLTTSRLIASDKAVDDALQQMARQYPSLGSKVAHVQVVYSPSIGLLKLPPICMERLKRFWIGFFQQIGCQAEWNSPKPTTDQALVVNASRL